VHLVMELGPFGVVIYGDAVLCLQLLCILLAQFDEIGFTSSISLGWSLTKDGEYKVIRSATYSTVCWQKSTS